MKTACGWLGLASFALLVASAQAQSPLAELQSRLTGTWTAAIEGEKRTRTMVIETVAQKGEGSYVMLGTFNFSDIKPYAFKDGAIYVSSGNVTLVFRTTADSVYTLSARPDGSFAGTAKYKDGQLKPATLVKQGAVSPRKTP
jgi:hypothetical protein